MSQDAHARPSGGAPEPLYDANIPTPTHAERREHWPPRSRPGRCAPLRWSRSATPTARS